MERKLASIQKIAKIEDIKFLNAEGVEETAQNIVKAHVLGWQCVTQRSNNFKEGDLVVYFEVDSVLPARPQWEFLRKKPDETSFRIKTIKLKGQFAQGLILPIESIPELKEVDEFEEGLDLTSILGIIKYEPEIPAQLAGQVMGDFPGFVSKTDETRIQTCPGVLVKRKGEKMVAAEKIDGSSITVFYVPRNTPGVPSKYLDSEDEWIFGVCSRNLSIKFDEGNAFWKAVMFYNLEQKLRERGKPIVLQGELHGAGIQKNKYKMEVVRIAWFNVVDPIKREYYNYKEFKDTIQELGMDTVPILDENFVLDHTVDQLVTYSIGKSVLNSGVWREGIVLRPHIESEERYLGRFSFKVINPEFLVKFNE